MIKNHEPYYNNNQRSYNIILPFFNKYTLFGEKLYTFFDDLILKLKILIP